MGNIYKNMNTYIHIYTSIISPLMILNWGCIQNSRPEKAVLILQSGQPIARACAEQNKFSLTTNNFILEIYVMFSCSLVNNLIIPPDSKDIQQTNINNTHISSWLYKKGKYCSEIDLFACFFIASCKKDKETMSIMRF